MKSSLVSIKDSYLQHRLVILAAAALLAFSLTACASNRESGPEMGGMEGPGEQHGPGDSSGEGGGGSDPEESSTRYPLPTMPTTEYLIQRNGVDLVLRYDATTQTFIGTATNTTKNTLSNVRVEIHLYDSATSTMALEELGPTPRMDLKPGESVSIHLPVTTKGQGFAFFAGHPETDTPGASAAQENSDAPRTSALSLGEWAAIDGVPLGIEHQGYDLRAWYTRDGDVWTPHLSPPAPQHQPTEAATWTGEWAGYYGDDPTLNTGEARVTVTLGNGTKATLALDDVPTLGNMQWDDMSVSDGRFSGTTTQNSGMYEAVGQFGGPNQAGVVGHASGADLRSVFYGEKGN